jgi:vacuolar-type H+-ATPase subunit F/Vma7
MFVCDYINALVEENVYTSSETKIMDFIDNIEDPDYSVVVVLAGLIQSIKNKV